MAFWVMKNVDSMKKKVRARGMTQKKQEERFIIEDFYRSEDCYLISGRLHNDVGGSSLPVSFRGGITEDRWNREANCRTARHVLYK